MSWKHLVLIGLLVAMLLLLIYLLLPNETVVNEDVVQLSPIRQNNQRSYYPDLNIDWQFDYPIGGVEYPPEPQPVVDIQPQKQPLQQPRRRHRFQQIIILQDNPEAALDMVREVARQEHEEFQHALDNPNAYVRVGDEIGTISSINKNSIGPIKPKQRDKRRELTGEFYNKLTTGKTDHKNDGQNVHDVNIRKCLTDKLLRIIELNEGPKDSIGGVALSEEEMLYAKSAQVNHEIQQKADVYFLKDPSAEEKKSRIKLVLEKIAMGHTLTMKDYKQYRENFILNNVWDRINHKSNFANREQLQISLIDNLLDATHKKGTLEAVANNIINAFMGGGQRPPTDVQSTWTTHCINGRVARVLASLTLLDADEKLSAPEMDEKELANEAYVKAEKILETALKSYELKDLKKDKPNRRSIDELYSEWDDDNLTKEEKKIVEDFENYAKSEIRSALLSDYEGLFPSSKLDEIIEKAQAGV